MISITRYMRNHWHITHNGRSIGVFDTYCQTAQHTRLINHRETK